ncbi:hypothetical protein SAMN05660657_05061 [Geodermatophilus amargosae]|uniref:Uncharacterized protein n=1 Tax=Geodermatophilus amargosae TaxID=1296565 RepID=A0A1I7CZ75_9ACTN|nr:hypothetical protein [Geodermatophilus amargosae]SFU04666.1 hypothetical protein SAMN05660657_05061 [Geodermatophilus amargosae]
MSEGPGPEWLPGPLPEDGDEWDRRVRAAIASGDLGRLEHALEAYRRHLDQLTVDALPVTLQRVESVVAEWAEDG